jgi:hypothetical protein
LFITGPSSSWSSVSAFREVAENFGAVLVVDIVNAHEFDASKAQAAAIDAAEIFILKYCYLYLYS